MQRNRVRGHLAGRLAWRLVGAAVTAVATAVGIVTAVPASAHHGVDNMVPTGNYNHSCYDAGAFQGPVCRTDNATLTVFRESSVGSTGSGTIGRMLNEQYNPTDLTVSYPSTPSYSGDAETDIIYQVRSDVPTGNDAYTWCNDANGTYTCDQQYVAYRTTGVITYGLSCHETGHAVGLTHGANASPQVSNTDPSLACMQRPVASGTGLGTHNTAHVNVTY